MPMHCRDIPSGCLIQRTLRRSGLLLPVYNQPPKSPGCLLLPPLPLPTSRFFQTRMLTFDDCKMKTMTSLLSSYSRARVSTYGAGEKGAVTVRPATLAAPSKVAHQRLTPVSRHPAPRRRNATGHPPTFCSTTSHAIEPRVKRSPGTRKDSYPAPGTLFLAWYVRRCIQSLPELSLMSSG